MRKTIMIIFMLILATVVFITATPGDPIKFLNVSQNVTAEVGGNTGIGNFTGSIYGLVIYQNGNQVSNLQDLTNANTSMKGYVDIFTDNRELIMGTSSDTKLDWSTVQSTANTLVWGLGFVARSIIFTDILNNNSDHDHPAQSNPTIFIHSATDPDTNNTQWSSITHDTGDTVIDTGSGKIVLDDTARVSGNLEVGDSVGADALEIWHNGTHVVFDSKLNYDFIFVDGNITFPGGGKIGNYNNTCLGFWSPAGTGELTVCD